jgi:UDP-N-acetylmuramate: L-alanyl-gamma-D-glutamyl-meso-diaminopimelate ligase
VPAIVREISRRGIQASAHAHVEEIVELLATRARAQDVILVMSNGAFGGLIPSLLAALEKRTNG